MDRDITHILTQTYGVTLSGPEHAALAAIMACRHVDKGEVIAPLHRHNRHMYFIESGLLREHYFKDGRDVTEHFGAEGGMMFCIESLFLDLPSQLVIEAVEPGTVWELDYASFKALTVSHPGIAALYQAVMELALVLSQRKADSWRYETAQERYRRFCREYPEASRRASVGHIASYLLMSPETLSRVRAGML